ncbi:MAG: hopanoid biosynthesis-associated protein HpnK [Gemmatimonadaceae bacterium]
MRRLIVNADDFGLADGIERGILEAHAAGSVTSASVIVTGANWARTVDRIRHAPLSLGLGLHFNAVAGHPLEQVPTLTNPRTGGFLPLAELAVRAVTGRVDPEEVQGECAAQLARLQATGIHVTHIDSHRHAHALPGCWAGVIAAARAGGVDTVRIPRESLRRNAALPVATVKKTLISLSSLFSARGTPPMRRADHFVGISLQGRADFADRLHHLLQHLPHGTTELLVHPGYVDRELIDLDSYLHERERELGVLLSDRVRDRLSRADISLVHFGTVVGAASRAH